MTYVALKPCSFAGQGFRIGESIPAELIQPGAAMNLVKMGIIAEVGSDIDTAGAPATTIKEPINVTPVVIHDEDGDINLEVTTEGMQQVFDALTSSASEATSIVETMTDGDALILLNAVDSRKTVKQATETKALEQNNEGE